MGLSLKLGEVVPLFHQLVDGTNTKVVKAYITDASDNPLPASPVTLTNIGEGGYNDQSVVMPSTAFLFVQYVVFENDGVTLAADDRGQDTFKLQFPSLLSSCLIKGKLVDSGCLPPDGKKKIVRGSDSIIELQIIDCDTGQPYDLTGWTELTAKLKNTDLTTLVKTTQLSGGVASTGSHTGGVTFTADNEGVAGDSISLVFDGIDDIDTVVNAWNTANPGNTVSHDGTGTDVLTAETVNLSGGVNAFQGVVPVSDTLGRLNVVLNELDTQGLLTGRSVDFNLTIQKGSETLIINFPNALNVCDPS